MSHQDRATMFKKRKIERACDSCRRKKTKCDGPKMSNSICTNCLQTHKSCTYVESSRPRGPSKAYVTGMEDRLEKLEALLRRLRPETDFSEELGPPIIRDSWKGVEDKPTRPSSHTSSSLSRSESSTPLQAYPVDTSSPFSQYRVPPPLKFKHSRRKSARVQDEEAPQTSGSDSDSSLEAGSSTDDECERFQALATQMPLLTSALRYHGKSSQSSLIKATRELKELRIQELSSDCETSRPCALRGDFWGPPPWEMHWEGLHVNSPSVLPALISEFPPPDLAQKLCDLYFIHVNTPWPLLHRPIFDRQFRDRLHYCNHWFACLCLCVFAVASRWCDDPRVIPAKDSSDRDSAGEPDWHQAGTHYFEAALDVHRFRRSVVGTPCLFEVQTFSLLAMFWRGRNHQHLAWLIVGVGIRKALDIGAHRRKTYTSKPTIEGELWKRAFWLLVAYERVDSTAVGRSCIVQDEDIDLELPLEVDDEYWENEDPTLAFQQPQGRPALVTAFNLWIQLTQVIAYALRILYAVDKSKLLFGVATARRREEVLAHLNTALKEWLNSVPEHLRWSNQIENQKFSSQSATIYSSYYSTRILIYRTFIPSPKGDSDDILRKHFSNIFPFPAVSICVDSAKSLAEIIDDQLKRGLSNTPCMTAVAHLGAALLLGHIWGLKCKSRAQLEGQLDDIKPPLAQTIESLMADVSTFLGALEWAAPRWENAAQSLRNIRESLPDADGPTLTPTIWLDSNPSQHYSTDRTTAPALVSQDTSDWPWYSAAQIPSKFSFCYTAVLNSLEPNTNDFQQSPWKIHELADEGQHGSTPLLSPLPVQSLWSDQSLPQQSCAITAHHTYSGTIQPLDLPRRVSTVGFVGTTGCLDTCSRQGEMLDVTYNANVEGGQHAHLQTVAYSDPANVHRSGAWDHNNRLTGWGDYRAANATGFGLSGAMWNNGSAYHQTPFSHPRSEIDCSQEARDIGPYNN